jgi:CHAT domain
VAEFIDFQISAWQVDANRAQVMVNTSPVGAMRKPLTVSVELDTHEELRSNHELGWRDDYGLGWPGTPNRAVEIGRSLSATLLPPVVHSLLLRSMERVSDDGGVRLRICVDGPLADLPWEYLFRPDAEDESLGGFLALDSRISLVREARAYPPTSKVRPRRQRAVLAGAHTPGDPDPFEIKEEMEELPKALSPLRELLTIESVRASEDEIVRALARPAAVFHYAGHTDTDTENGRPYLLSDMRPDAPRLYANQLASLLREAGVRLAVFTACNSGRWAFVKPLLDSGIDAVVSARGNVSGPGAIAFGQKLYSSLAVGMSLDEAITWARLHMVEAGFARSTASLEWGTFIAYAPTPDTVLLPRPRSRGARQLQDATRQERSQTIFNVYQNIGTVSGQVTGVSAGAIGVTRDP